MPYLRPKYAKFNFGWGSAPDPARGAYNAPPDPLGGVKGDLLLKEGRGDGERRGGEGKPERNNCLGAPEFVAMPLLSSFCIFACSDSAVVHPVHQAPL